MPAKAHPAELRDIEGLRDVYRREMNCQIIHDSIHSRDGWTKEYLLLYDGVAVGYGSVAMGGPWREQPAIYEYFVLPEYRTRIFDLFGVLLESSGVKKIETQSNDPLLSVMLNTFARNVASESILFRDAAVTAHTAGEAVFRRVKPEDADEITQTDLDRDAEWLVTVRGKIAATGGILYHYNRPYGDLYMKVAEAYRRKGLGTFILQEMKKRCYQDGTIPAARCNVINVASRRTLQKAGFVPCGHILTGAVEGVDPER